MYVLRNSIRIHLLSAALLVLSLAIPAAAETPESTPVAVTRAISALHIDNFGQINPNYYRGAQPKGRDFEALAKLGIKLDIDLAREGDTHEAAYAERAGMKFVRIPLSTGEAPPQSAIDQFLKLVLDPVNQPVYVHCMGGKHRTGAMTAVYRMTQNGWNADQAFREMKRYKFGFDFMHPELKSFVYSYFARLDKSQSPVLATSTPAIK